MAAFGHWETQVILLTAFAPFGPKGYVTGTNASQVVLGRRAIAPGRWVFSESPASQAHSSNTAKHLTRRQNESHGGPRRPCACRFRWAGTLPPWPSVALVPSPC